MNPTRGAQGPDYVLVLRAFLSVAFICETASVGFSLLPVNSMIIGFVSLIRIVGIAIAFGMPESPWVGYRLYDFH